MCNNPVPFSVMHNDKYRSSSPVVAMYLKKLMIPCGNCLGCRLDKLALWSARCNYELYKSRSAFVTFTYDEFHLKYKEGALYPTLCQDDLHKYIDNLRHKVKKMVVLPDGCRSDFSYFASGEYGDKFKRPHYHVLFFGLDFHDCRKLFESSWKFGMVKSLPLRSGGIRYVVDYFTKNMVSGDLAISMYDSKGLERPFKSVSRGLGSELFFSHRDDIRLGHDLKIGSRVVPVPVYYKNLLCNYSDNEFFFRLKYSRKHYDDIVKDSIKAGFSDVDKYLEYIRYSNELSLTSKFRSSGVPVSSLVSSLAPKKADLSSILTSISVENYTKS